jgi:hypothetical protein
MHLKKIDSKFLCFIIILSKMTSFSGLAIDDQSFSIKHAGLTVFNSNIFFENIALYSDRPILFAAYLFYEGKKIYDAEIKELQHHFQQKYLKKLEKETNEAISSIKVVSTVSYPDDVNFGQRYLSLDGDEPYITYESINIDFPHHIFTSDKVKTFSTYIYSYYQQLTQGKSYYFELITKLSKIFQKYKKDFANSSSEIREKYQIATDFIERGLSRYEEDETITDAFDVIEKINDEFIEKMSETQNSLDEMKPVYVEICRKNGIREEDFVEVLFDITYRLNRSIISLSRSLDRVNNTLIQMSQN